jgi:DNA-binding transcriptional LysR family regulator
MTKPVNWEARIGRRIRLRDLHILFTVIQHGGMGKAATSLGISQPAVSEAIAGLEHALGARLLDRSRRGAEPTLYADALLRRGRAAFDELRQAVSEIESLSDPATGEVRVACAESLSAAILPPIIQRFSRQYPGVVVRIDQVASPTIIPTVGLPELRERRVDLVLARLAEPYVPQDLRDDVNVEILFDDPMVLAVGSHHPLARRRKIDLAELANEPWILPPPESLNHQVVEAAFHARGLAMPRVLIVSYSVHLRHSLLSSDRFITAYASTNLCFNGERLPFKVLSVALPARPWPVAIVSLKNRTPNPTVQRFIEQVRAFAKSRASVLAKLRRASIQQRPA